jgi:hypothetical protein
MQLFFREIGKQSPVQKIRGKKPWKIGVSLTSSTFTKLFSNDFLKMCNIRHSEKKYGIQLSRFANFESLCFKN